MGDLFFAECLRSSQPPVASVASMAELGVFFPANKIDEAYTANRAGRRGGRDSPKVDIALKCCPGR